jgi:quercetin dioxygenase-like cupin family protein
MSAAKKKTARRKSGKARVSSATPNALKNTVRTNPAVTATLKYLSWNDVKVEAMNPLLGRQLIVGHQVMLARVLLKKGCIVPLHSHVNEQLSYILEGALKFYIDGKEIVVRAGEVLTIPPNITHNAEAIEYTVDLDIFNPPRADWIIKTDSYLRK